MTSPELEKRLDAITRQIADIKRRAPGLEDDHDDAAVLAEWHRLRALPEPAPRPLDPDIARMSDAEAVDMCHRLCRKSWR